jgi:hypothetical protein
MQIKLHDGCPAAKGMLNFIRKEQREFNKLKEVMTMATVTEKIQKTETEQETSGFNFWADKQPCWEKCHCPELIKAECPAAAYQFLAC